MVGIFDLMGERSLLHECQSGTELVGGLGSLVKTEIGSSNSLWGKYTERTCCLFEITIANDLALIFDERSSEKLSGKIFLERSLRNVLPLRSHDLE